MNSSTRRRLDGILAGSDEPVFRVLPQRVLEDMSRTNSESALIWNVIYPRAQPALAMKKLLSLPPLWGSSIDPVSDELVPYFWGFDLEGRRLPELDPVLDLIDGPGLQTEVDLFLVGSTELVLIEAKHMSGLGRCGRYGLGRCPEIHGSDSEQSCRYWAEEQARFPILLEFGLRPGPEDSAPPCNRHYQLGRSALVGDALAKRLDRRLHLWLVLPREKWGAIERDWVDFAERIINDRLWRRLRVLAWEDVRSLGP